MIGSAVVTGAGRGIGRAIAVRLARDGHAVVAAARTAAGLDETAAEARARAPGAVAITVSVADVAVEDDVDRLRGLAADLGPLRVWVNNAAVVEAQPFAAITPEGWDRVIAVNLRGVFLGCRAAVGAMAGSGGGVIVNLGSLSGVANVEKFAGLAAYNVSKAGVIALTEAVALEGRELGVRCVCISPGAVDTEMLRRAAPHLRPRVGPDDIAALVAFLVSDDAAPLSGVNIPVFSNG